MLANFLAALRARDMVGAALSRGELFQTRYADHANVSVLNLVGGGMQFDVVERVTLFPAHVWGGRRILPMGILLPSDPV